MTPAYWLQTTARLMPDVPALMTGEALDHSYASFARHAAGFGGALRAGGCGPGDRIAVFMENSTDYLIALYGIWWAGCIAVPVNAKLHPREVHWIVENSDARLCVVSSAKELSLADAVLPCDLIGPDRFAEMTAADPMPDPAAMDPGDTIWLFYTSGTTGRPKGVMITTANILAMCLGYFAHIGRPGPGDAALYAAPISHGAGLYNFMNVMGGARHVVAPSGGFDAQEVLDLSRAVGNVSMFAAPTMVRRLTDVAKQTGATGEGIDTIIYAGGPMYLADILEAVDVMGPRFAQIYGQGECPMSITVLPKANVVDRSHARWKSRLGSVGFAQPVCTVKVIGQDGAALPSGMPGEVCVKGPNVMAGYWRAPEATADTLRDGWLHTGDIGHLDADGFLTLVDRSKDVIISGGSNVYPREIEELLLTHPGVSEVAVVGIADPEWGESIVAHVVGSAHQAELDQLCIDNIARFKRPRAYVFHDSLPKNNYGKVLKRALR